MNTSFADSVTIEISPLNQEQQRLRIDVQGVVQGVGFRPFVYGLATRLRLSGLVGNDSQGVFIEVEGVQSGLDTFCKELISLAPPLAYIEAAQRVVIPLQHSNGFEIVHSQSQSVAHTLISPDLCICDQCLAELFDPGNRRYCYPFINCTHCGPRFTITRDIPYDRPLTTMASFDLCPTCQAEYENPLDRRFHAQPNACADCGPQVKLRMADGRWQTANEAIQTAQAMFAKGEIIAVKGLGGFHLACDASNDQAVQILRQRKGRVDKPFAVMAWDVETASRFAEINAQEAALLQSHQRPIVLLRKRDDCALSEWIAPGNHYIGVMLPYTPLHYLLLAGQGPNAEGEMRNDSNSQFAIRNSQFVLVMTSGNLSDEPIVKDNDEAIEKLAGLADAILLHNRPIHMRCDDSVVRVVASSSQLTQSESQKNAGYELPMRRSRGYAPFPVKLPFSVAPILAIGGELKSTFCLTVENHAFLSQHIGDMENLETLESFSKAIEHFKQIFRVQPERIACDLHPAYLSAKWARANAQGIPVVTVQHHHAHVAALMAEQGLDSKQRVIGFSFDGTGYGTDGAIWGGEVLIADYRSFERAAHLKYVPLPGGDAAVKRPYRQALAHLWAANVEWNELLPPVAASTLTERNVLLRQFESNFNCVSTSSVGRLFDAIASLIGVRQTATYEGQAAIEMEALVNVAADQIYRFGIQEGSPIIFDAAPVIAAVVEDRLKGLPSAQIAARFHYSVAGLILQIAHLLRRKQGLQTIALSGGVFQNVVLLQLATNLLESNGFTVLSHRLVPPNDGGLALGQAVVAAFS